MAAERLRLGFLGVGWIGRHRMQALLESGLAEAIALADPAADCLDAAAQLAPAAARCQDLAQLLALPLDGIVIATPSASHAAQSIAALEHGLAVFCQKPLGRSAAEVAGVLEAAARADRRLGVDLSYRHLAGMDAARALVAEGALGRVHAMELVFHNAYGPDKPWFRNRALAGGGCVMDLGIHLVDLALWLAGGTAVTGVTSRCYAGGVPLRDVSDAVEDYATARLDLADGTAVDLACSWNLPIGVDAEIRARVFGSKGAITLRNVDGSFYDFVIEQHGGGQHRVLGSPPDAWGGRAAVAWAREVLDGRGHDADGATGLLAVAGALDAIYRSEMERGRGQ